LFNPPDISGTDGLVEEPEKQPEEQQSTDNSEQTPGDTSDDRDWPNARIDAATSRNDPDPVDKEEPYDPDKHDPRGNDFW